MQPLEGKVAIVTGGTFGVGRGVGRALAEHGARVFVTGRSAQDGLPLDENVTGIRCDHRFEAQVTAAFQRIAHEAGGNRGDSFCYDIWCIGVTSVTPSAETGNAVYKVDVHIFSDAGSGGKIHGKMNLFLVDDHGRRFPLLPDPSVTPFTRDLAPQEGIDTKGFLTSSTVTPYEISARV
jgi:NAD(P)-dependent dehydrogenase (short-subunit alcohol dehydrogenase family)